MKLSISVPSYNYAKYLQACLDSIQQQSYTNYEVLIADGGSKDGSLEIIYKICEEDDRFRLVSIEDNGQSDAIFKTFKHATGDVLCFLNADDCYLCNDTFSNVVETFHKYNAISIVSFGGYYLDSTGHWIAPIRYRYHPFDGFHLMKYRTAVLQPATFWKKEVYDAVEWPRAYNFVFDVVFFYSAYQKFSWLELSKPVAGYRLHGSNKSMTVRYERILELATFESIKFGGNSTRVHYLNLIGKLVKCLDGLGLCGKWANKLIYLTVNTLSYITCYRFPSI